MKSTVLTGIMFLCTGAVANAQLSFLPQIGFEQGRSTLNYNSLSASGVEGAFKASLKTDYRFKGGHGPFINLGTSPAPVSFAFNNAGSLIDGYEAATNNLQFRIETGYQYTSKAIQLGKKKTASQTTTTPTANEYSYERKSCGSYVYRSSSCGSKKQAAKTVTVDNTLNMRLQPSVAFAYIPSNTETITPTTDGFTYATAWKTAIVPAMGFEFAKGRQRFLTLSVFYTKPFGMNDETFTSGSGVKAVSTTLIPNPSTWGITAGIPFSFAKSNVAKTPKMKKECNRTYYRRCSKI